MPDVGAAKPDFSLQGGAYAGAACAGQKKDDFTVSILLPVYCRILFYDSFGRSDLS